MVHTAGPGWRTDSRVHKRGVARRSVVSTLSIWRPITKDIHIVVFPANVAVVIANNVSITLEVGIETVNPRIAFVRSDFI